MRAKKPEPWYKVKATDYYAEFEEPVDQWSGTLAKVRNGLPIVVRWKDGTQTPETLRVLRYQARAQVDMTNIPDTFKAQRLYVLRVIGGVKVKVPLLGLKIRPA